MFSRSTLVQFSAIIISWLRTTELYGFYSLSWPCKWCNLSVLLVIATDATPQDATRRLVTNAKSK